MSFFLQSVYSESFFLALALAALLLAEHGRFPAAAVAAGGALLTRPLGIAVLAAVAVVAWRSPVRPRARASLVLGPLLFVLYPLVLWLQVGDPLAFLRVEGGWQRHLSLAGPLGGLWDGVLVGWQGLETLATGRGPALPGIDAQQVAALNVEALAFLGLFVWLTAATWRRYGTAYGLLAALPVGMPLSLPADTLPLQSLPRFGVVAFPFSLVLAGTTRCRIGLWAFGLSALLLGVSVVQWALWDWVA